MSETQKWMVSISGAVVGQLAVLAFFYLIIINPSAVKLSAKVVSETNEVTVMLSQMIDQAEMAPPESPEEEEEKPEEEEKEAEEPPTPEEDLFAKAFINTDTNTARDEAPENAPFESDRNTTASTEFLPDPNEPSEVGPTLRGEDQIKHLSLENQEYVDGEIRPDATPPPASMSHAAVPPVMGEEDQPEEGEAENEEAEIPSQPAPMLADRIVEGDSLENEVGEGDRPPDTLAETEAEPDSINMGNEAKTTASETYLDPDSKNSQQSADETGYDDENMARRLTEFKGPPGAPKEKKEIAAAPPEPKRTESRMKQPAQPASMSYAEIQRKLDESMFDPAYLAFRRKNNQNGDITDFGEGSVDAESTEIGKYKKAVNQAIGRKWHQYRIDRGADVTWGLIRIKFFVTPKGNVRSLRIIEKDATELVTEFSLRAIVDAKIPSMPPEVAAQLGGQGLEMNYNIVIY